MLSLSADSSGTALVIQTNEPPTIYLDHGVLMSIAEDTSLATRFIVTLKNQHGTLALSWVNLAEFAKIRDQRQVRAVEQFVDAILPQLFFIAVDPWAVIRSEDEVLQGHKTQSKWGHVELLKLFVIRKETPSLNPLTGRDLFSNLRDSRILRGLDKLGDQFISRIESLRKHYAEDTEFAKAVRKPPKGSAVLPATRLLLRELLGFFVKSTTKKLTRNDAADFFHAIVPLAYCDYVLLDGHWATQASVAAHRLYQAGQIETIAQAFSQRQNGLLTFFDALESKTA
jgi:hypothetical protein